MDHWLCIFQQGAHEQVKEMNLNVPLKLFLTEPVLYRQRYHSSLNIAQNLVKKPRQKNLANFFLSFN